MSEDGYNDYKAPEDIKFGPTEAFTKERSEEAPMTVGDLMNLLSSLPPGMEILHQRYSDFEYVTKSMWTLVTAIKNKGTAGAWLQRAHPSMTPEELQRWDAHSYLHLEGN